MRSVSTNFHRAADKSARKISFNVLMAFHKTYDASIGFFTLNSSALNSGDFLQGTQTIVQEWDKYTYDDISSRVISVEWQKEETTPYSFVMGIADVVLDNHDDLFTPGESQNYADVILPRRPIRILAGFEGENVPVFIGLTEEMPEIDKKNKTAKFHCIDFITLLYEQKLTEAVIYEDMRTDEILDELLQLVGLSPTQYDLDVGLLTIPFAFFEKDSKFGDAVKDLMIAECGTFFMDENGVIRFRNKQNFDDTAQFTFNEGNTLDFKTRREHDIINVVEITSRVREVQSTTSIYELSSPILVPGNGSVIKFFDYQDPVTSVNTPTYEAYSNSDGSGTDLTANITITEQVDFSKASKVTFSNSSSTDAYITNLQVNGTPAIVVKEIFLREQDDTSITKYEEQVLQIENEYIQSEDDARTIALVLLQFYSEAGSIYEASVKGSPALQLNDQVTVNLGTDDTGYAIQKMFCSIEKGKFTQRLGMRVRPDLSFFILNQSALNGGDLISP